MFHGKKINAAAAILMAAGLLGANGCATESADENAESAATGMPADHPAADSAAPGETGEMMAPHGRVSVVAYQCADDQGFQLTVAPGVGQAALRIGEDVYQLDQQEVASGSEFSDGTYTFRGEGPEAFVEKDGERIFTDCLAQGHPGGAGN